MAAHCQADSDGKDRDPKIALMSLSNTVLQPHHQPAPMNAAEYLEHQRFLNFDISFDPDDISDEDLIDVARRRGIPIVDAQVSDDNEDAAILGCGNFAKVVKLTWSGNTRVAIKVLQPRLGRPQRKHLLHEALLMSQLGFHPNLVDFVGITVHPLGMVLECLDMTLRDFLDFRVCESELPEAILPSLRRLDARFFHLAKGVASALHHLHHFCEMAHLDIKPSNVLLSESLHKVKLTDMGISQVQQANAVAGGSPRYMSPETTKRGQFTVQTDIWSFGMVMFELLELGLPFPNQRTRRGVEALILGMRLPELPDELDFNEAQYPAVKKLISSCWSHAPQERPKICAIAGELQKLQGEQDQRCKGACVVDKLMAANPQE